LSAALGSRLSAISFQILSNRSPDHPGDRRLAFQRRELLISQCDRYPVRKLPALWSCHDGEIALSIVLHKTHETSHKLGLASSFWASSAQRGRIALAASPETNHACRNAGRSRST